MATITTRVPHISWKHGFERHWNGGNPAVTHAFNALSFLLPQAERFFIEIVREVMRDMGNDCKPELKVAVKNFITQESAHSYQHSQYNLILEQQGYDNVVYSFVDRLQEQTRSRFSSLSKLAIVCGYEHYTAILGNYILSNPDALTRATQEMALIWGWHSAEETEHKAVCFDLYYAVGGSWLKRVLLFVPVTLNFSIMFARLYISMLYRDGMLKPSRIGKTSRQSARFFFGRAGIAWHLIGYGLCYISPWFHPWNQDNRSKLQSWLTANESSLRVVGATK